MAGGSQVVIDPLLTAVDIGATVRGVDELCFVAVHRRPRFRRGMVLADDEFPLKPSRAWLRQRGRSVTIPDATTRSLDASAEPTIDYVGD